MTEDQLSALLRTVKRYEQPPPGYFDGLLRDMHRRQRTELLQRPLWKIALERMQTFFGEHSMSPVRYASAMAGIVVVGVTAIAVITPGKVDRKQEGGTMLAAVTAAPAAAPAQVTSKPTEPFFTLDSRQMTNVARKEIIPIAPHNANSPAIPPHYVSGVTPVSREPESAGWGL
jgi:hypothetical protein